MGKRYGQHFLIDKNIARKIIQSANLKETDLVLEIGPGKGILTEEILTHPIKKFIAVEIDRKLAEALQKKFLPSIQEKKLEIICADFLKFNLQSLEKYPNPLRVSPSPQPPMESVYSGLIRSHRTSPLEGEVSGGDSVSEGIGEKGEGIKIIANIPYYLSGAILKKILTFPNWKLSVLLLQKEVAERVVASPGSRSYGILTISAQVYSQAEIIGDVPARVFRPSPKVDSAIVRFLRREEPLISQEEEKGFFNLLHAGFQQRRKFLLNALTKNLPRAFSGIPAKAGESLPFGRTPYSVLNKNKLRKIFLELDFPLNIRAENLSISDFKRLNTILNF